MNKCQNFCCICMQKAKLLTSLQSVDADNVEYIEKLNFCVPRETWKNSYQICHLCKSQLDVAYNFIQCCLESEKFRKEELDHDKNLFQIHQENNENKSHNEKRETNFTCDHCNKTFKQKKYLSQHITKLHICRKKKARCKKAIKKEQWDRDLLKQDNNSRKITPEFSYIHVKVDDSIKDELSLEISKSIVENGAVVDREEKTELTAFKSDLSETEDLKDITYVGNDENYENYSAESEVDNDLDKPIKSSGSKRGPKKEPQQCSFCDEVFLKRHEWATHIRTKHTFQKPFSCDLCDATYMNRYSLLIHKRKHTNEKPFICATCGKSFVSSADLNHHNKIHDAGRAYPCPMCDRSFKTHSNLRTHRMQMHLDPAEWKFACHHCDKKFPIRGNLVKHLKRHSGIKEFNCHVCDKSFVNRAELSLHLNTHTNQRLFKCKMCGKDYKNREGLRRHMKVVHDQGNWKAPKSEKTHLCPMCPKIFAFGNKLQRHIFTHTGEKPFKCDYCQKRFIDNYGRKVHYKKDHNIVLPFG